MVRGPSSASSCTAVASADKEERSPGTPSDFAGSPAAAAASASDCARSSGRTSNARFTAATASACESPTTSGARVGADTSSPNGAACVAAPPTARISPRERSVDGSSTSDTASTFSRAPGSRPRSARVASMREGSAWPSSSTRMPSSVNGVRREPVSHRRSAASKRRVVVSFVMSTMASWSCARTASAATGIVASPFSQRA